MHVYVTSATSVLSTDRAPVGGGVAVLEALLPRLVADHGFDVTLLRPGRVDSDGYEGRVRVRELAVSTFAGEGRDRLLELDERAYARFALEWERALGRFFEALDPAGAIVLANDVSEGPPFAALARLGFAQVVLYHVVVGEFFARQYLQYRGRGPSAATAARWWRRGERLGLGRVLPELLNLVWKKEEAAARHAHAICPSRGLADSLAAIYPDSGIAARTDVVPWGVIGQPDPKRRARRSATLAALGVDPERHLLMTMSRLSREKRIELVLNALIALERDRPDLAQRCALVVAGAPAYMGGAAYARRVQRRARALALVRVHFVGYVSGDRKWDLLSAADHFVSTSSYEAYGLGIAQALAAGTPVVSTAHEGARAILADGEIGTVVEPDARSLNRALLAALEASAEHARSRAAAWGEEHGFDRAAAQVARILNNSVGAAV